MAVTRITADGYQVSDDAIDDIGGWVVDATKHVLEDGRRYFALAGGQTFNISPAGAPYSTGDNYLGDGKQRMPEYKPQKPTLSS